VSVAVSRLRRISILRTTGLGRALVMGQVAISVTALAVGGMLLHSLVNLETMDIGFDRDHVVVVDMSGDASGLRRNKSEIFMTVSSLRHSSCPVYVRLRCPRLRQ
jgi:hypothetical protein